MSEIVVCGLAIINVLTVVMNIKLYTEIMKEKCQTARRKPEEK